MDYNNECADRIEEMMNSFSFNPSRVCKRLETYAHRTIQQTITRFCIEWLRTCASDSYRYDARNEQSHIVAKKLLDGNDMDIWLPMV